MSKITRKTWYERVNATWPVFVPKPTPEEAIRGARKLYRFAFGKPFTGTVRITTGNRYTWIRRGVMYVNAADGWDGRRGIVHLLSHYAHSRLNPGAGDHTGAHARLEIRMIKEVLKRGWLNTPRMLEAYAEIDKALAAGTSLWLVVWGAKNSS